jgi:tripartite-type tricarboxylate transporter receptor subunit TctC
MFNKIIAVILLTLTFAAHSQTVKVVIPFGAGGIVDTTNRVLHSALERELGREIGIESRPGAGGQIGLRHIAQNKNSDVLFTFIDALALANAMSLDDKIDLEDYRYIIQVGRSSGIALIVKKGSPLKNIQAWRNYRGNPITIGANGHGGAHHFYSWTLNNQVAFPRTDVFFKGINEALPMVIGGHMDAMWSQYANIEAYEREGKVDIVATNSPLALSVPSFKELGIDAPLTKWIVIANQSADPATVRILETAIGRLLNTSEFVKSLQATGVTPEPNLTGRSKETTIQTLQQQRKFVEYVKTLK